MCACNTPVPAALAQAVQAKGHKGKNALFFWLFLRVLRGEDAFFVKSRALLLNYDLDI